MDKNQMLEFIRTSKANNVSDESIRTTLRLNGMNDADIEAALQSTNSSAVTSTILQESKKKGIVSSRKKTKIIIWTIIILVIIFFLGYLFVSTQTPFLETCIQSNTVAQDTVTGNSLKYVQCIKGYDTEKFPDGGADRTSQVTGGYIISNQNGDIISTIQGSQYNNAGLAEGTIPHYYFPGETFFLDGVSTPGYVIAQPGEVYNFKNNTVQKMATLPVIAEMFAYDNGEIYYLNDENTIVSKYNLLTQEISIVADLNDIPRSPTYTKLYNKEISKNNGVLTMNFQVIVTDNLDTIDNYSLDLKSGSVTKISTENRYEQKNETFYNIPPAVTYSTVPGTASTYKLNYENNPDMANYKLLLLFHKARPLSY